MNPVSQPPTGMWKPYDPCPCGCGVIGWKLQRFLPDEPLQHVVGCDCVRHRNKRNRVKGKAAQAKGHRALGGIGFTPSNEESHNGYDIRVQVEHKGGYPKSTAMFRRFVETEWFRHALGQATRAIRTGDGGTLPAVMLDGRWLLVDCKKVGPE